MKVPGGCVGSRGKAGRQPGGGTVIVVEQLGPGTKGLLVAVVGGHGCSREDVHTRQNVANHTARKCRQRHRRARAHTQDRPLRGAARVLRVESHAPRRARAAVANGGTHVWAVWESTSGLVTASKLLGQAEL